MMDTETEEKIQSIILETFQDIEGEWISYFQHKAKQMNIEGEWISYFQHKAKQMNLDQKSFFIGMMYPKIVKNLEDNNIHIRIKSDSWGDHEIKKINSMLGALYEKFV
jgi:hypothetical protein